MSKTMTVVFFRPVPLVLLVISVFYLWVYLRRTRETTSKESQPTIDSPLQLGTP